MVSGARETATVLTWVAVQYLPQSILVSGYGGGEVKHHGAPSRLEGTGKLSSGSCKHFRRTLAKTFQLKISGLEKPQSPKDRSRPEAQPTDILIRQSGFYLERHPNLKLSQQPRPGSTHFRPRVVAHHPICSRGLSITVVWGGITQLTSACL